METINDFDYSNEDEQCSYEACENPRFVVPEDNGYGKCGMEPILIETGKPVDLLKEIEFRNELSEEIRAKALAHLIFIEGDEINIETHKGIGVRLKHFKD